MIVVEGDGFKSSYSVIVNSLTEVLAIKDNKLSEKEALHIFKFPYTASQNVYWAKYIYKNIIEEFISLAQMLKDKEKIDSLIQKIKFFPLKDKILSFKVIFLQNTNQRL